MERYGLVDNTGKVRRVLVYTFLANEAVAAAKLVWGYLTGSVGMFSDGLHSLFDGITNVLGLIGIWMSSHPPDPEHPYGHRKFETLFTFFVSLLIFLTCYGVLVRSYRSLTGGAPAVEAGTVSFLTMAATILVNVIVMVYERRKGGELRSAFLIADAQHTKSNVLSSLGVVVGLVFTAAGHPKADALAGVVVAVFIARIGYDILKGASEVLVDAVRMDVGAVCEAVLSVEGVRSCHNVRTRGTEHHVSLDLHIQLDPEITLRKAHGITHMVQHRLRENFPEVEDIVVHTEPAAPESPTR